MKGEWNMEREQYIKFIEEALKDATLRELKLIWAYLSAMIGWIGGTASDDTEAVFFCFDDAAFDWLSKKTNRLPKKEAS